MFLVTALEHDKVVGGFALAYTDMGQVSRLLFMPRQFVDVVSKVETTF